MSSEKDRQHEGHPKDLEGQRTRSDQSGTSRADMSAGPSPTRPSEQGETRSSEQGESRSSEQGQTPQQNGRPRQEGTPRQAGDADALSARSGADPGDSSGLSVSDDRLLALALGLDDDPALRQVVEASESLSERLARMETELNAVADGVLSSVPEPPPDWVDLSSQRWMDLRPYVAASDTREGFGRKRLGARLGWLRRWQVVAPAVAAVLAVVVLGVALQHGALSPMGDADSGDTLKTAQTPVPAAGGAELADTANDATSAYQVVAVARAAEAVGDEQSFTVLRTLRGTTQPRVQLTTESGAPVPKGTLVVLFLDPLDAASFCPSPGLADISIATRDATDGTGEQATESGMSAGSTYLHRGRCAAVLPLPEGVVADDVSLP